jgi:signal transduction histidine kinase
MKDAITTVLEMVEDKTNMKKIEVKTEFDEPIGVINTDKKRLTQVMLNLINNAIKFTKRGGNIEIRISNIVDLDDQMTHVKVAIKDSGVGIKQEDRHKLFQLFGMLDS